MDMMSYSKKYSRLLLWGIFSFLVLTGNLLSVIGYSSLINISPVFKLGIGVILLFFCFFIYVHKMYLQPIITQYFIDNKSEIWLLFLIAHSKR